MKPSQDEVWEWACNLAKESKCHPIRVIGMFDTYYGFTQNIESTMGIVEEKLRRELNAKEK